MTLTPLLSRANWLCFFAALPLSPRLAYSQSNASPAHTFLTAEKEMHLVSALDLSEDQFKLIRAALVRNDYASAQHRLADYFRQRSSVTWKFDPHLLDKTTHFDKQIVDDAVRGHVQGGKIPVWANFPDGKIDWLYNETFHQPGVAHNIGWQSQLLSVA